MDFAHSQFGLDALHFDEAWYLEAYADVATAVQRGDWPSGFMHYCSIGRAKGRLGGPKVDESWYRQTYPLAAAEVACGRATSLTDHYFRVGRHRGYLPFKESKRPGNPVRYRSTFGGLWTDLTDACDAVEAKLDLGLITKEQANWLRSWIRDGYVVLEGAIPPPVLERALNEVNKVYEGGRKDLRFQIHGIGQEQYWMPEAKERPTKALDLHWFSEEIRELIFTPRILEVLQLIFQRRVMASQTLTFWRGSAQEGHQDSAYVNYSKPMQFAASWIALEDVAEGAGELFYYPGSHELPEYTYAGFKGVEEAARLGVKREVLNREISAHVERIRALSEGTFSNPKRKFLARKGDVFIWSADLAHGGSPISKDKTRKSVVTHYCPADCVPSFFELHAGGGQLRSYKKVAWYASGHYGRNSMLASEAS